MDKSNIDISVVISHFEIHNRSEGKSPRTVQWYNEMLDMFYRWLKDEGLPTTLGSVGEMEARRFVLYIQKRPGLKGATATNQLKPATLETGLVVQVPNFIDVGEVIRVDTATGAYGSRAKWAHRSRPGPPGLPLLGEGTYPLGAICGPP